MSEQQSAPVVEAQRFPAGLFIKLLILQFGEIYVKVVLVTNTVAALMPWV